MSMVFTTQCINQKKGHFLMNTQIYLYIPSRVLHTHIVTIIIFIIRPPATKTKPVL